MNRRLLFGSRKARYTKNIYVAVVHTTLRYKAIHEFHKFAWNAKKRVFCATFFLIVSFFPFH